MPSFNIARILWVFGLFFFAAHCFAVMRWKDEVAAKNSYHLAILVLALAATLKYLS